MSKYEGWPTTRCFSRTLAEAFPKDPSNAEWFYPPEKPSGWSNAVLGTAGVMMWVVICYLLAKN